MLSYLFSTSRAHPGLSRTQHRRVLVRASAETAKFASFDAMLTSFEEPVVLVGKGKYQSKYACVLSLSDHLAQFGRRLSSRVLRVRGPKHHSCSFETSTPRLVLLDCYLCLLLYRLNRNVFLFTRLATSIGILLGVLFYL